MTRAFHSDSRTWSNFQPAELAKLCGVTAGRWPLYVLKQLLDNAVAALEEHAVRNKKLHVKIYAGMMSVEDSGPGISDDVLDKILDFDRFGGSNRHYKLPTRGAQGNALMTIVGIACAWGGTVSIRRPSGLEVRLDVNLNAVTQTVSVTRTPMGGRGPSRISVSFPPVLPWKPRGAEYSELWSLVEGFVRVNPHCSFIVSTPGAGKGRSYYGIPAEDSALAAVPYPLDCGTAFWFTENDFTERLSADVRARPGMPVLKWAHEFAFSSVSGLAANASALRGSLGERFAQMPEALFKASATRIFSAVRAASDVEKAKDPGFAAVGADTLAAMAVRRGADAAVTPQYHAVRGHHALPDGTIVPFLVEGCLVEMPVSAKEAPSPQFTMNRTIMYGSPVFKGVKWREKVRGDWHSTEGDLNALCALYQVDRRPSPAAVTLHVTCPNPGYSGYGKQQFDTTWLVDAVTEVMERITLQIRKQRAGESRRKSANDGPRDSIRDTLFGVLPKLWERETENGSLPIMIRQMYYATRKIWHTVHRDDLQYGTFCAYVDEYERNVAREEICLRDPRGTLLEPHSGRELRLGTDAVAKFNPKKWEGHTIVFVEKEGFAHLLKAYGVTKRYDAIIIGSKGFAVEACRVVLQKYNKLLGDLVNIIALHDADPAGYMIGYDLATNLPRFGENTKINVVDAGLTVTEARRLGLQDEPFDLKKSVWSMVNNMRSKRVSDPDGRTRALIDGDAWDAFMPPMYRGTDYPTWASNPRGRRVELNAMAPRQFVNWLEGVLDANGCRKVRPPDAIVDAQMAKARENKVRNEVGEMLMRRLGNDVVAELLGRVGVPSYDLDGVLAKKPEQHWEYLVTQAAQSGMNLEPLIDQALSQRFNK